MNKVFPETRRPGSQIQHLHHGPVADDRITQHIDFVAACPVFGISGYHDHLVDMSAGRT